MEKDPIEALIIEDNPGDARLIKEMLAESVSGAFDIKWVDRLSKGIDHLKNNSVDIVLLDISLPDSMGMETFKKMMEHAPTIPVIVLTGIDDERMAIASLRTGSQDYLVKGKVNGDLLVRSILYAIERKRLEDELRAARNEMEQRVIRRTAELSSANEALKEAKTRAELYLDLMGHDISNIHQIIEGQLELAQEIMAEEGKLEGDEKELIDMPLQTLKRSNKLIDNVRKLQKMEAGEYNPEPMDIGGLLVDVAATYSNVPGKDVSIACAPARGCHVDANPLLKDVFVNLVDNAVKHSSGPIHVNIGMDKVVEEGRAFYRVAVEDDGPGIPDRKKNVIFHRLSRGQTTAKGTGLGLYIVKTLVEGFRGKVNVEDRVPGNYTQGTRFLVYLPALEDGHGE